MKRRDFIKSAGLVALPAGAIGGGAWVNRKHPAGPEERLVLISSELLGDLYEHCFTFRQYYFDSGHCSCSVYRQKVTDDMRQIVKVLGHRGRE